MRHPDLAATRVTAQAATIATGTSLAQAQGNSSWRTWWCMSNASLAAADELAFADVKAWALAVTEFRVKGCCWESLLHGVNMCLQLCYTCTH